MKSNEPDRVITPSEAARLLGVDPKTLTRWANSNKIPSFKTLGGHRRYKLSSVQAIIANN